MKTYLLVLIILLSSTALSAQDGTLDPTFGNNGIVQVSPMVIHTDFSLDGKLLVLAKGPLGYEIHRYDKRGSLDQTFGHGGKISNSGGRALTVQPDGKIVVLGITSTGAWPYTVYYYWALERYNVDGTQDNSFGNNGSVTIPKGDRSHFAGAETIFEASDSLIIFSYNYFSPSGQFRSFHAVSAGTSYKGFGPSRYDFPASLAFINNKSFITGGRIGFPSQLRISKYDDSLTLSEDFGVNGHTTIADIPFIDNLAIQLDDKVVGSSDDTLLRFTSAGIPDLTFGNNGRIKSLLEIKSVTVENDGKIIVAGNYNRHVAVARHNNDGSPDLSFGINGITTIDYQIDPVDSRIDEGTIMAVADQRLYVYANKNISSSEGNKGVLFALTLTSNCTPPTFLNTLPIVGPATCGNNNGQISIIPQSGTAPYQYSIDGGTTYTSGPNAGYTFFYLAPGTYQL